MIALSQSVKRKLSLLQLADELGNVARAFKIIGYHRDIFYEVRLAFQTGGAARVTNELRLSGVEVSPSGVRGVWLRHYLETRYKRYMRLERESRD